jgi:hypothetical protein
MAFGNCNGGGESIALSSLRAPQAVPSSQRIVTAFRPLGGRIGLILDSVHLTASGALAGAGAVLATSLVVQYLLEC